MLILTIDNLAERYKCLPSEALLKADTFDLHVLDVSAKWARRQQDIADGKVPVGKMPSQEEMLAMVEKVKKETV
jgi:hypothetical protein